MFFSGNASPVVQTAQTNRSDLLLEVTRNRHYQLGVSDLTPTGLRHLDAVVVSSNGNPLANVAQNVEIDLEKGRVYIEADAPDINDGDTLTVTYDVLASTRTVIIGRGDEIRGSLRFISANPVGSQKDYYWPYVKITPNGDYALKGSEWMQLGFSFEVLKLGGRERVYAETAAVTAGAVNRPAQGAPSITGTPTVGTPAVADVSAITDADGLGTFSYQWLLDGVVISGATASTYTPAAADATKSLSVRVSFTDGRGFAEQVVSAGTTVS